MEQRILSLLAQPDMRYCDITEEVYRQTKEVISKSHQDSAPYHTANDTIDCLIKENIDFITKEQWIPKSPDAASMDYFVWGWIKNYVRKIRIRTKEELKEAILKARNELPLDFIRKTLESWPKRLQEIIEAKGCHI